MKNVRAYVMPHQLKRVEMSLWLKVYKEENDPRNACNVFSPVQVSSNAFRLHLKCDVRFFTSGNDAIADSVTGSGTTYKVVNKASLIEPIGTSFFCKLP